MAPLSVRSLCCLLLVASLAALGQCNVATYLQAALPDSVAVSGQESQAIVDVPEHSDGALLAAFPGFNTQDNNNNNNDRKSVSSLASGVGNQAGRLATNVGLTFKNWVSSTVASHRDYWNVMSRLHNWHAEYSSLYSSLGDEKLHNYMKPIDLLQVMFAQVDQELSERALERAHTLGRLEHLYRDDNSDKGEERIDVDRTVANSFETVAYLFTALKKLIERLEASLAEIKSSAGNGNRLPVEPANSSLSRSTLEPMKATQEYKDSMDRVKRILMDSTKRLVSKELLLITRTASLNALATHISSAPLEPGSLLYNLAPLITKVGAANTPLLISYLNTVQIRVALGVLDSINPAPKLVKRFLNKVKGN